MLDEELTSRSAKKMKSEVQQKGFSRPLVLTTFAVFLGTAFPVGYNMFVMNAPLEVLSEFFNASYYDRNGEYLDNAKLDLLLSITTAMYPVGAVIGSLISAPLAQRFGSKRVLLGSHSVIYLGSISMGLSMPAESYEMIMVGRTLFGIFAGLSAVATTYLMEISPKHLRGSLGGVFQMGFTSSILVAQVLGLPVILGNDWGWPYLLCATSITSTIQICLLPWCSRESPAYLLTNKQDAQLAEEALKFMRQSNDVQEEFKLLQTEAQLAEGKHKASFWELFKSPPHLRALGVACAIGLALQIGGFPSLAYFSTNIFRSAGLSVDQSTYLTLGVGGLNTLAVFLALNLLDRIGRRPTVLIGTAGQCVLAVALTLSLTYSNEEWVAFLSVAITILYSSFASFGPGTVRWLIAPELFPENSRAAAVGITAVVATWAPNSVIGATYLPLYNAIQQYTFTVYASASLLLFIYIFLNLPETNSMDVNETFKNFEKRVGRRTSITEYDNYNFSNGSLKGDGTGGDQNCTATNHTMANKAAIDDEIELPIKANVNNYGSALLSESDIIMHF